MRRSTSTPSRATSASTLDDRGLGEDRLRRAAAGQHAAGRRVSRRGIFPRRRPAGGDARTAARPSASTPTRSPSTARPWARTSRAPRSQRRRRHPALRQAAEAAGRLQGAARQSVRFRDHEDERDLRRVPQALSCPTRRTRTPSRAAPSCSTGRRIITTASTIRRSKIDEHTHPVHARRRPDRLSGLGRGGEHAAAGGADQKGHHRRCPASATAGSPAPRARRRSSTPRRRRRPAAGWRCSRPATACASISTRAPPTF